jgi:hypothetical protein
MITNKQQKLFHCFNSLEDETVKQNEYSRNNSQNNNRTKSLRDLASMVLERNKARNNIETKVNNFVSSNENKCNKNEITENAKYLFFERLGISDNCELAIDETLNYINQKLTIN